MWHAVYKKLWIVILAPMLAAGAAYFLTAKKAGQYRSTSIVEASVPEETKDPDVYYKNMVETMKTEVITSMVSYRLLLHDLETEIAFRPPAIQYSNERKSAIQKTLEKKLSSFELLSETVPTEATIGQVIHNMDYNVGRWVRDGDLLIRRKPATNEIDVATITEDPFLSAFASNSLAQEYIRYENSLVAPAPIANDSVGYYREEVDRLRKNLEAKNDGLNEANSKVRTSGPAEDIRLQRAKQNKVAEYEMKITEEEWELTRLREQFSKMQREPAPQQRSSSDVKTSTKIQAIRNKIDQLSGIYAQGGSKDKKLDSIINVLRKQLNDETTRLQMSQQSTPSAQTAGDREREMLTSRIQRHEQNIQSIRNDIRRLKSSGNQPVNDSRSVAAQLKSNQQQATTEYNAALAHLKMLETKAGINNGPASRESHHLVLKEKALPSAQPESPYAMIIVLVAFFGTLILCIIVIAATRPAPQPYDDIFLRVNYANRRVNKKSAPTEA